MLILKMKIKKLLLFTAFLEFTVGLALFLIPAILISLLFGIESTDNLIFLGRFAGICLICFSMACWQRKDGADGKVNSPAVNSMFIYNLLIAVYLLYLKFSVGLDGSLLLPAGIYHTSITLVYISLMINEKKKS